MIITRAYSPGILNELINKTILFHNALLEKEKKNEKIIEAILSTTKNDERQIIRNNYKKIFHHPIQEDIISFLKEKNIHLHNISLNMFDTPFEYDARELKKALTLNNNNNIDENILIEIFCSRPKSHLEIVDLAFKKFFNISLKEELENKLSKEFSKYILTLMDTERSKEQTLFKKESYEIAENIIKNGFKLYINDINLFKKIFVEKSRKDLILISRAYYELTKKCLYDDIIEGNISQNIEINDINEENKEINNILKLIKHLLFAVITPAQFFAKKCILALNDSININDLIRILICRAEIDIKMIRDYYFKETKCDIKTDIKNNSELKDNANLINILINILK